MIVLRSKISASSKSGSDVNNRIVSLRDPDFVAAILDWTPSEIVDLVIGISFDWWWEDEFNSSSVSILVELDKDELKF